MLGNIFQIPSKGFNGREMELLYSVINYGDKYKKTNIAETEQLELPQASAIVTKTSSRKDVFNFLCAIRDGDGISLLHKLTEMERIILAYHYKTTAQSDIEYRKYLPS